MEPPQYLFRVYSDESTGFNSATLFNPHIYTSGSSTDIKDVLNSPPRLAECLRKTLCWLDDNDDTPFINWTDSFVLAIVYALYKLHPKPGNTKRSAEHNINIICINTATAVDEFGKAVVFTKSSELMKKYNVQLRQPYDNEYATIGSVFPRKGSFVLGLDKLLKAGLYKLHPALHTAFLRSDPRWRLTTIDFRNFWHTTEAFLSIEHIHLAAHLASLAVPVGRKDPYPLPFLAAILAMQKRSPTDKSLEKWLALFGRVYSDSVGNERSKDPVAATDVDKQQFYDLLNVLAKKDITHLAYVPCVNGKLLGTSDEAEEWLAFQAARKAKRREEFQHSVGPDDRGADVSAIGQGECRLRRARLDARRQRRYNRASGRKRR